MRAGEERERGREGASYRLELRPLLQSTSGLFSHLWHFPWAESWILTAEPKKPWNTPRLTQHMWPELMWRPAPCKEKNLCSCSSHSLSFSLNICLPFLFAVQHATLHRQESTAALMTQTAQHYELYLPVALGLSPYGVLYTSPNMCSCGGLSQLAKPNPIYYLWEDINSRDCDPLRLNGPLKPSIILSSSSGEREFMWRTGCNVIYANNAYLWHTLPVARFMKFDQ